MKISFQLVLAGIVAAAVTGGAQQTKSAAIASARPQPDRLLFDRSTQFFVHKKYAEAILTLHTLMNGYPESQYVEGAKLRLEDCWRLPDCAVDRAQVESQLSNGGGAEVHYLSQCTCERHNGIPLWRAQDSRDPA